MAKHGQTVVKLWSKWWSNGGQKHGQIVVKTVVKTVVNPRSNCGRTVVKWRSNGGRTLVKQWSNCGQNGGRTLVKQWSNCGQNGGRTVVKTRVKRWLSMSSTREQHSRAPVVFPARQQGRCFPASSLAREIEFDLSSCRERADSRTAVLCSSLHHQKEKKVHQKVERTSPHT
jgi:hypothetical protein